MTKKIRIIVAGIGGVGGYFGGLLAKKYSNSPEVEIDFVARGGHLKQIRNNGLKIVTPNEEFTVFPNIATDCPSKIGIADHILICTKSYDLEAMLELLKPCINENTVILPLLNGVDGDERIKTILPDTMILNGCVYIVSRLKDWGVVENSGNIQKLYFGIDNFTNDKLLLLEKLFLEADIDAKLSENISAIIWEKFIYITPVATATSYYDNCLGEILDASDKREILFRLIYEVAQIAYNLGVISNKEIVEKTQRKLSLFPYESTSSMHRDYQNHKQNTEIETLTGYVVRAGIRHNIATPNFEEIYKILINKR